jgi:hypothetical protein
MAAFLMGIGDVNNHQPAMTASLFQRFCRTFNTLLAQADFPSREQLLEVMFMQAPDQLVKNTYTWCVP